jgi:hypothetical protein
MADRQYRIKSGDSLAAIAYEQLGSESAFRDIAMANALDIFQPLPIGTIINLPALSEAKAAIAPSISALALTGLKQPETGNPFQLVSWVL